MFLKLGKISSIIIILKTFSSLLILWFVNLQLTLKSHPGVFWVDTSIKLTNWTHSGITLKALKASHGALLLSSTGHSTYAATHPQMYKYLATDINNMKKEEQRESGAMMIFRTKTLYEEVLSWWAFCALVEDCIAPIPERACRFTDDTYNEWAGCHRFDQSAINILLSNAVKPYDSWRYYVHNSGQINVSRGVKISPYSLKYKCNIPTQWVFPFICCQ